MLIQCCVCKKIRQEGRWVPDGKPVEDAGRVSHGYCPACAARAFEEIRIWERVFGASKGREPGSFPVLRANQQDDCHTPFLARRICF